MIIVGEVPDLYEIAVSCNLACGWKQRAGVADFILVPPDPTSKYAVALEGNDDTIYRVCQHGHEKFLRTLFTRHPTGVTVRTPIAEYTSLEHFEEIQPAIRDAYLKKYGADPCGCKFEALADEAERGYDVEHLIGKPSLDVSELRRHTRGK